MSFWNSIGDAVGSALGSVGVNSLANILQGNQNVKNTNAINANQMQLNKQFQEWQYLNQPQLQVQGMKAAGINPAMQGAVTNASSTSNGSAGTMNMQAQTGVSQQSINDALLMDKQRDVLDSQKKLNDWKAVEAGASADKMRAEERATNFDTQFIKPLEQRLLAAKSALTEQETLNAQEMLNKIQAETAEAYERIELMKSEKKVNEKQLEVMAATVEKLQAEKVEALTRALANKASAAASYASARFSNAAAATERSKKALFDKEGTLTVSKQEYQDYLNKQERLRTKAIKELGQGWQEFKEVWSTLIGSGGIQSAGNAIGNIITSLAK